jgi:AcrR family transcriptional regulator
MGTKAGKKAVAGRRTQTERSEATRSRLMEAVVDLLATHGYAATSTTLVAAAAGLSRGALTHQYPSRAALMVDVVRTTYEADIAAYRAALARVADPGDRAIALVDISWNRFKSPGGIAQTEIWIAMRSDPELAAVVRPIHDEITASSHEAHARMLRAAGCTDRARSDALSIMSVAMLRGLAIELVLGTPEAQLRPALAILKQQYRELVAQHPAKQRPRRSGRS